MFRIRISNLKFQILYILSIHVNSSPRASHAAAAPPLKSGDDKREGAGRVLHL